MKQINLSYSHVNKQLSNKRQSFVQSLYARKLSCNQSQKVIHVRSELLFKPEIRYASTGKLQPLGEITSVKDLIDIIGEIQNDNNQGFKHGLLDSSDTQKQYIKSPVNRKLSLWFRGQANVKWTLLSSIFRGEVISGKEEEGPQYLDEQGVLNHFTAIHPELRQHALFDVLAIAQHHGLATRLLDWSYSAINALLFAVDGKENDVDGEFFILNPLKLNYYSTSKYGIFRPEHPEVSLRAELSMIRNMEDLISPKAKFARFYPENVTKNFNAQIYLDYKYDKYCEDQKNAAQANSTDNLLLSKEAYFNKVLTYPVATFPLWKDSRLQVQQGVFTIDAGKFSFSNYSNNALPSPKNLFELQAMAFEEAAAEKDGSREKSSFLISYRIPHQYKYSIERELRRLGINRGLLFPEMEHQASYLKSIWSYPSSGDPWSKINTSTECEHDPELPASNVPRIKT